MLDSVDESTGILLFSVGLVVGDVFRGVVGVVGDVLCSVVVDLVEDVIDGVGDVVVGVIVVAIIVVVILRVVVGASVRCFVVVKACFFVVLIVGVVSSTMLS